MPTARPRLTITLTPEIDRALADFARMTKTSKSAFIVDLLAQSVPHMEKVAVVLQQAQRLQGKARDVAIARMANYSDAITAQGASIIRTSELFFDAVAGEGAGARKDEHAERAAAEDREPQPSPPHPNRGGRQRNPGGKVVSIGGVKRGS